MWHAINPENARRETDLLARSDAEFRKTAARTGLQILVRLSRPRLGFDGPFYWDRGSLACSHFANPSWYTLTRSKLKPCSSMIRPAARPAAQMSPPAPPPPS